MFYLVAVYCCNMYFGLKGGGEGRKLVKHTCAVNVLLLVALAIWHPYLASSKCAQLYSLCATFIRTGLQVNILNKNILAYLN